MSIFRYPGGKSRMLKPLYEHITKLPLETYHEVFVGGGSVLVHVAQQSPNTVLFANDLDRDIYCFWQLVASGTQAQVEEFSERIKARPTVTLFKELRANPPTSETSLPERAYRAVFFNRTTFSGISTSGPIGGSAQKSDWSIDCRYNAPRMLKEFTELRTLFHGRLKVTNLHCLDYLRALEPDCSTQACYLDPPYYVKGKALYRHYMTEFEHEQLSYALKGRKNWVLSYDSCPEIEKLYGAWTDSSTLDTRYSVNGEKTDWANAKEKLYYRV